MTPEQKARANIDATTGVAIREFPLNPGFGFADCLLFVNGKACGVIEAKKQGATLTGVELQSSRYAQGLLPLAEQTRIVAEVDRHLSIIREVEAEVDVNLLRAQALRQATLAKAYT